MQTVPDGAGERRHGIPAIPEFLDKYLTADQMEALHHVENFGWHLAFVRRPMFQDALPVLEHSDNHNHAVLPPKGELDLNPEMTFRA